MVGRRIKRIGPENLNLFNPPRLVAVPNAWGPEWHVHDASGHFIPKGCPSFFPNEEAAEAWIEKANREGWKHYSREESEYLVFWVDGSVTTTREEIHG